MRSSLGSTLACCKVGPRFESRQEILGNTSLSNSDEKKWIGPQCNTYPSSKSYQLTKKPNKKANENFRRRKLKRANNKVHLSEEDNVKRKS